VTRQSPGSTVVIKTDVDESIIGGLVVHSDELVFDVSLKTLVGCATRLRHLARSLESLGANTRRSCAGSSPPSRPCPPPTRRSASVPCARPTRHPSSRRARSSRPACALASSSSRSRLASTRCSSSSSSPPRHSLSLPRASHHSRTHPPVSLLSITPSPTLTHPPSLPRSHRTRCFAIRTISSRPDKAPRSFAIERRGCIGG